MFTINFKNFFAGAAPLAHLDPLTERGSGGHYSIASNIDIISQPGFLTQGPGLANLTNGTQAGVVSELIRDILDVAVDATNTYAIGTTKLFKLTAAEVLSGGTPSWPVSITDCVEGKSIAYLKGKLYYLFNRNADGAIGVYDLNNTFNHAWQTGLAKADLMPSATKEDILIFGHGQYIGVYFASTDTINKTRLDFGANHNVADVVFSGNQWLIAVNGGAGVRNYSQIYTYEAGATTALLSDEVSVGLQKIGFLFPLNGIVYVCYQDYSFDGGYKIGYLSGRRIEPLTSFTGSLPNHRQKTLYRNNLLFLSGGLVYATGATTPDLPFAISQLADGGYATCGAMAAPFGTPIIASTETTNYRLAKFSGYDTACSFKSLIMPVSSGRFLGYIDEVIVRTSSLLANARADLKLEYNQGNSASSAYQITGTGLRRFIFKINSGGVEDIRLFLDWTNGHAANPCLIKSVQALGHYVER